LKEIEDLRAILPLCSFCKKIRDDEGYWEQVDIYIHKRLKADITHASARNVRKSIIPAYLYPKAKRKNADRLTRVLFLIACV